MVPLNSLKPGDHVVINCPKSRVAARRNAEFVGIQTGADALRNPPAPPGTRVLFTDLPRPEARYAQFLIRKGTRIGTFSTSADITFALMVLPDDRMEDDEHREVFVEEVLPF